MERVTRPAYAALGDGFCFGDLGDVVFAFFGDLGDVLLVFFGDLGDVPFVFLGDLGDAPVFPRTGVRRFGEADFPRLAAIAP
jgi:hypothetical protein